MQLVSEKSLDPDRNEFLRALLNDLVRDEFGGKKSRAAVAIGVSPSYVQEFLGGTRGAGRKLLEALADYTKRPIDELMGREGHEPEPEPGTLGALPGWAEAQSEAVRKYGKTIPAASFAKAAATRSSNPPSVVTVEFVRKMADAWFQATLDEDDDTEGK